MLAWIRRIVPVVTGALVLGGVALVATAPQPLEAQTQTQPQLETQTPPTQPPAPRAAPETAAAADPEALPAVAEVIEDLEPMAGYYRLYRDKNKLLAFIRKDQLGEEFLVATSIARGRMVFGFQWSEALMQWRRVDKQLLLVMPDVRHHAEQGSPIADAVARTYTETVVRTLPILAEDPKGNVVIDLGALYTSSPEAFFGDIVKQADPALARLNTVKAFPQNLEVAVDLYTKDQDTGFADLLTVHYSLSHVPETGYQPRLADDRLGYFLTAKKDFSRSTRDDTRFTRLINRWHIEKADPKLAMSPPKQPIVFYLDKNIPVQYRRYVREGVLEWNKAFETLGIVDAIVVRQQTDTNEFAAFDPEDVRYNFVRWITSDVPFAMGPSRTHPRTGQILDADIVFDDSMMRWLMSEYDILLEEGIRSELAPELRGFLEENPDRHPARNLKAQRLARERTRQRSHRGLASPPPAVDPYAPGGPLDALGAEGRGLCSIGRGRSHQFNMAALALGAATAPGVVPGEAWPEELVGQFVKETIMHEVGHTLGLRHNFKGSAWQPLDAANPADSTQAPPVVLSASVMDYNPLNIVVGDGVQGNYLNTTLGPYDYWAIEYGYTPLAGDAKTIADSLAAIASRAAEPGLEYATDEDVWGADPLVNRWDLGADPLDFAQQRFELYEKLKANLVDRAVPEGESYARLRQALDAILVDFTYSSVLASRYVGGSFVRRDHRGDPNERPPLEVVPVETQRRALELVAEQVFSDRAFQFDPELLNKLVASRWRHWGSRDFTLDSSYELHDRLLSMQGWVLFQLINPVTLRHMHDAEMRLAETDDTVTIPELFLTLSGSIFSELEGSPATVGVYNERQPYISSVRRNLQRQYVEELTAIALSRGVYPHPARTLAWDALRALGEQVDSALASGTGLDAYSASHLRECRERIERAVTAEFEMSG